MQHYSLDDKTFIFLGSSVTYGSDAGGKSFVDFIAEHNHCTCIKEAVSGTTLVDNGSESYIQRMLNNLDTQIHCDHFICQLSTNDAGQNKPLGVLVKGYDMNEFDTSTIMGAIEYIIAYALHTWKCPVSFYTGTYYESKNYKKMVDALGTIEEKWRNRGLGIIDLWHNADMLKLQKNNPTKFAQYMSDGAVHPTLLGYDEWWTPVFEEYLKSYQ